MGKENDDEKRFLGFRLFLKERFRENVNTRRKSKLTFQLIRKEKIATKNKVINALYSLNIYYMKYLGKENVEDEKNK